VFGRRCASATKVQYLELLAQRGKARSVCEASIARFASKASP
jgi:hypothetical protein